MKKNIRMSNLELLRIVSILLIISFHFVFKGEYSFGSDFSINKLIVKTFYMFGELGVNCFVLITGYFSIKSDFKYKKVFQLAFQVLFYTILGTIFAKVIGFYELKTIKEYVTTFFPIIMGEYWYVTAYVMLYIFSPYINKLVSTMKKDEYKKFLLLLLVVYSIIPTFFGALNNNTEGLLYYNRFIWLIVMYLIGGYIKLYKIPVLSTSKKSLKIFLISFITIIFSIIFIDKFEGAFKFIGITEVAYLWQPNNIIMLLLSVSLFGVFENLKIKNNKVVNKISSTTLGIYLLHDGILTYWFWREVFKNSQYQESPYLILVILGSTFAIFVIGIIIEMIRQLLERYTITKLLNSKKFEKTAEKINNMVYKIFNINKTSKKNS